MPCSFEIGWVQTQIRINDLVMSSDVVPFWPGNQKLFRARADEHFWEAANPTFASSSNTSIFFDISGTTVDLIDFTALASSLLTVAMANTSPQPAENFSLTTMCSRSNGLQSTWNTSAVQYTIEGFYNGFGYRVDLFAVQISLAILSVYCCLVTAHIVYSLWFGISSSAFDSVYEIIALAMNSRPVEELQNTCAGIQTTGVFQHRVRIASTNGSEQSHGNESEADGCHLELLFPSTEGCAISEVKLNHAYGALKEKSN